MSDTNRVAVRFIEEGTFGVTPATPAFRELRYTGAPTLAFVPQTVTSDEIRSDRQVTDLVLVGGETTGELNGELLVRNKDPLYESAFFSAFVARYSRTNTDGATQITAVSTTAYTVSSSTTLTANDIVRAEDFTNSANNGFKIVDTGATGTSIPILGGGLVTETPPGTARIHLVGRRGAASDLVAATGPNRLTSTTLNFTTLGLAVGDWIKINGTGGTWPAANNIFVRISILAANSLTFDVAPGWTANGGASATVDLYFGERLRNGVTRKSFAIEEEFTDHSPVDFQYLNGMVAGGVTLTATAQEIVKEEWKFLGTTATFATPGSRFAGATTLTAQPTSVLNAASNVARIAVGGSAISGNNFATEFTIEIDNNLDQLYAVGSLSAVGLKVGGFDVTGTLPTYFDTVANANLVINNTASSIDARFTDAASHVHLWDLPRVKFSAGSPEVPGKNDVVTVPLEYRAIMHETLGYTAQLTRFQGVQ